MSTTYDSLLYPSLSFPFPLFRMYATWSFFFITKEMAVTPLYFLTKDAYICSLTKVSVNFLNYLLILLYHWTIKKNIIFHFFNQGTSIIINWFSYHVSLGLSKWICYQTYICMAYHDIYFENNISHVNQIIWKLKAEEN